MKHIPQRCIVSACWAVGIVQLYSLQVFAGSEWLGESRNGITDYLELKRCMDEERASGSHKYTRCSAENKQRQDDREEKKETLRMKQEQEKRELEELTKGPNVFEEMHARYGRYFTFDECMSVYNDRALYGKREFPRADARSECTKAVNQLRTNCLRFREEECVDKGYLRADQTAGALQQQQLESQQRQQEVAERRQEQEQQRRKAMREQWIRQGGTPGACPGLQALLDKNHPCQY